MTDVSKVVIGAQRIPHPGIERVRMSGESIRKGFSEMPLR